jgi:hypothetical protein
MGCGGRSETWVQDALRAMEGSSSEAVAKSGSGCGRSGLFSGDATCEFAPTRKSEDKADVRSVRGGSKAAARFTEEGPSITERRCRRIDLYVGRYPMTGYVHVIYI